MAKLSPGRHQKRRQERARERREINVVNYETGNFRNASDPGMALERAKKDVNNLYKKLPRF